MNNKGKIIGIIVEQGRGPERVEITINPTQETLDQLAREIDKAFMDSEVASMWKGVPYDQQSESSKLLRREWARGAWLCGARPVKMPPSTDASPKRACPTNNCNLD